MFKIAICDDTPIVCEQITEILQQHEEAEQLTVTAYQSGTELYKSLQKGKMFDLIILDIMIPEHDGLQIGRLLRENLTDNLTQILYISSEKEYAMSLFDLRPLNFLTKPIQAEKLLECVDKAMELNRSDGGYFTFMNRKVATRIPFREIRYFEADNKQVRIHTVKETFSCYLKIREVHASEEFIQIHKSFIVNYMYVKTFRYDSLILDDETMLPISYPFRKSVRSVLSDRLFPF